MDGRQQLENLYTWTKELKALLDLNPSYELSQLELDCTCMYVIIKLPTTNEAFKKELLMEVSLE